jgi:glycogen debranching enzyme
MIDEIIQVHDQFYILATSSRLAEFGRVLKHDETFAVLDRFGNIQQIGLGEQGLYHEGTRYLSRLELLIDGRRPLLLSSMVREDNSLLMVDLTNPDFSVDSHVLLPRDTIHVSRFSFLWNGTRYEKLRLRSYLLQSVEVRFTIRFEADFADVFEVRGTKRARRGEAISPVIDAGRVQLAYRGLDEQVRRTIIEFQPPPDQIQAARADYCCTLPARGEESFDITVSCEAASERRKAMTFDSAASTAAEEIHLSRAEDAAVLSSNEQFNDWFNRSTADVHLMLTRTPHGPYPYAGVPWFSAVFGRDGIITALQYLWINPALARGVLGHLAAEQATESNPLQDAEPGKILHESRRGEMAALGEIPFGRYYGSVDSTPLFVMLAGAYYERTGDLELIRSIWPNIRAAIQWIDRYGDVDGDGFVEYFKQSPTGLIAQGWKDSVDSIFHSDGALAVGPTALCEVQGYVYAAKRAASQLARVLGDAEWSDRLRDESEKLRRQFEETFWCEELSTYALALDGQKRPCRVRTSNPGHCLYTGIVSRERAVRVADTLVDAESFSGWGVRTVSAGEIRYNPMSYHNGSVWPHDNALLASGFARYRLTAHVLRVFTGIFDASLFVDLHRMPELFCGFERRPDEGPTLYPVACAPQSWAAAAAPSLLQSMLGMTIDAPGRQIRFAYPALPPSLQRLWIRNLRIGGASVDLVFERTAADVNIELLGRKGEIELIILK